MTTFRRVTAARHDPWRPRRLGGVPQIAEAAEPVDGPVTVLAFVDRYPPCQNAGAEWYLHHALRDSGRRGHRVLVATATRDRYALEGVEVHPRSDVHDLAREADVLVGHLLWTRDVIDLATTRNLPLVYLSHNDHQVRFWRIRPENVSVLVSNSDWVAKTDAHRHPRNVVVRPPVLLEDYALDRDPGEQEWVTLVNVTREKGSDLFYDLARGMPLRKFLAVQGAYGNQQPPGSSARNVQWHPQTSRIRDDIYARTRVLLVPSVYESWGRVAVEALCSGIPVIAHPTPGLVEALGDAGIFADREDTQAWAAALRRLDDPDIYARASARARERAAELDARARADLDVWDHTIRLAATAKEVSMANHDPFRPPKRRFVHAETRAKAPRSGENGRKASDTGGDPREPLWAELEALGLKPDKRLGLRKLQEVVAEARARA